MLEKSSSYHALGACLRQYNAFLSRKTLSESAHGFFDVLWLGLVLMDVFCPNVCEKDVLMKCAFSVLVSWLVNVLGQRQLILEVELDVLNVCLMEVVCKSVVVEV
ncbi:hypothetical protein Tco_0647428 [Tanacetum coccineum]